LLEPAIGLAHQKNGLEHRLLILCLLIAGCAVVLWKTRQNTVIAQDIAPEENNLSLRRKLHWMALAFVPSSLLLG